ncbi:MAG: serine/threonine-protein kinase, partial [Planctomycetota bacterium]
MNPNPPKNISKSKTSLPKPSTEEVKKEAEAITVKNYRIPTPKKEEGLPPKTPSSNSPNASSESIVIQNHLPPEFQNKFHERSSPNIDLEGPEVDFKALENVLGKNIKSAIPDSLLEEEVDPDAVTVFDSDPEGSNEIEPESPTQGDENDLVETKGDKRSNSEVLTLSEKNISPSDYQTMVEKKTALAEAQSQTKSAATLGKIASYQKRRYRYVGELGAGGMGQVFKAMDLNLKREIAVKVLGKNLENQEGPIGRFLAEAQITSQLEHPNIIPVHELGSDRKGQIFFTMKKVEGKPLSHIISRLKVNDTNTLKKYTPQEILRNFRKICDAVAFAHASRVIHRDLKPDNIMIGKFGEVLVMDWGLAKVLDKKESPKKSAEPIIQTARQESGAHTIDGTISGTPLYMSPEQAEGRNSEIRESADIYSLGSILFELFTYVPPVQGKNLQEILKNVMAGKLFNVQLHQKNIPPELFAIISKCLQLKPSQRYPSVEALSQDVDAYLDDHPVSCYSGNI